jgi:hypothetical protein
MRERASLRTAFLVAVIAEALMISFTVAFQRKVDRFRK